MSLSEIRVNTTKTRTGVGTITYTETGPVITGIATASNFKTGSTNVHSTGVELANINTGGSTATFGGAISGTTASFSGTVSIGGTLTYEDVTNIDAVGLITARNGINVTGNILGTQDQTFIGANTSDGSDNKSVMLGGGGSTSISRGAYVWVKGNEYSGSGGELILAGGGVSSSLIDFYTNSGQRARITSTGELNIGGSYSQTTNKLNVTGTAYVSSDITAGDDIIAADEIRNNVPGDFWATDNTFISLNSYGNLTHQGSYQTCLTSNGYRTSTSGQWKSYAANSTTGAAQIRLDPTGYISFGTESNKANGSTWVVTERLRITSGGAIQNYYNTSLPVTDSRPILQLGYGVIGDDSSGYNAVTCNAYPVNGNSTWHYIGSSSLGASRYHIGFGDHKWFTASAGTRGNDITWSERLRIDSSGRVLIGGGSSPTQVGDGQLIVYGDTRLHPGIKVDCIDGGSNRANGYTMLADNYAADESLVNIGLAYSSGSLVLSRGCKVSNSSDTGYISSMDSFAIRPCALRIDDSGALSFHTTENTATTTTDSAVSITEVFQIDRVGNIYQRITNRFMFFGASNQLKIGIVSSDPVIDATSGHLQLKKNGSTVCTVRDDHLQMYGDIKMNQGKGIDFSSAVDVASGETVASSVLDDYEEGTYTPTISNLGNHTTHNTNTYGAYTKIGDLVTVRFKYQWTNRSTTNGAYNVTVSLPFSGANVSQPGHGSCGVEGCQPNASDRTSYHSSVPNQASYVQFRCSGANVSENSFNGATSTSLANGYFMGVVSYKTT